jgi:hypothetical protein
MDEIEETKEKPEAETSPTESAEPERERVIYSIERSQLAERFGTISVDDITDPIVAPLLPLIKRNIAFAAIPENFGEGSACYLINLTSLK